jgi:hypothetical protein
LKIFSIPHCLSLRFKSPARLRLSILLICVAAIAMLPAQTPVSTSTLPALMPPPTGFSFPTHLTLTYNVDWRVFTAGKAVFHVDTVGNTVRVTADATTFGAVNMLFPVADHFQSVFDAHTGCSASSGKLTQEGRRKVDTQFVFDYTRGQQVMTEKNLVKGTSKQQQSPIPACVTDSLSSLFYIASQTLQLGQSFQFPLADSLHTFAVTLRTELREDIKSPAGAFHTVRVQPVAQTGIVKNREKLQIWFTDDARHIPVQMRATLLWGPITFSLVSIEQK